MDKAAVFGTADGGSIPSRGTVFFQKFTKYNLGKEYKKKNILKICRGAGIGRQAGLRILCPTTGVWVRLPPAAPESDLMAFCQPFGGRRTAPPIDFAPLRALRARPK